LVPRRRSKNARSLLVLRAVQKQRRAKYVILAIFLIGNCRNMENAFPRKKSLYFLLTFALYKVAPGDEDANKTIFTFSFPVTLTFDL